MQHHATSGATLRTRRVCSRGPNLFISALWAAISIATSAAGSTIGVNFLTGGNVGGTNGSALTPTDTGGAGAYAQVNWNNVASTVVPGNGTYGTNVSVVDSL